MPVTDLGHVASRAALITSGFVILGGPCSIARGAFESVAALLAEVHVDPTLPTEVVRWKRVSPCAKTPVVARRTG